ncbi:hypothetical protein M422DRAFT_155868 [Sphaerobolus stellatus SS14]|nr:hypothetical protein M422DRAFT_155868 [Sphaerobolus stellatus SS14]
MLHREQEYFDKAIDSAIAAQEDAVELIPDSHREKSSYLNNIGFSLQSRHVRLGQLADLDRAIMAQRIVVTVTLDSHPEKASYLNNLGVSLESRFKRLGDVPDLDNAITAQKQAITLSSNGHPNKAIRLSNLGRSLHSQFRRLGNMVDIDEAIQVQQEAVILVPNGHANRVNYFANLGNSLHSRFQRSGDLQDLEDGIQAHRSALTFTLDSHPDKASYHNSLGAILQSGFTGTGKLKYLDEAILTHKQKVHQRYEELAEIGNEVNHAAAIAISYGDLPLALEYLEEGRSIVWNQILQLRTPLKDLHIQEPDLAMSLERVSQALEYAGIKRDTGHLEKDIPKGDLEEESKAQQHRAIATEYDTLIKHVRTLKGFETFLKPKKLADLLSVSQDGPVVILNIASSHSDALILLSPSGRDPIIHIPLVNFSHEQAKTLSSQMNTFLTTHHARELSENADVPLPHLTWCATGPLAFLPLHAAEIYDSDDPSQSVNISDFAISSYTPTLSILLRPYIELSASPANILIVTQPNTPGQKRLPGTKEEVKAILKHLSIEDTTHLDDKQATVPAVLEAMSKNNWIHLVCHGIQNAKDPIKSAFALEGGMLNLETLMAKSLDHAEFAFLSVHVRLRPAMRTFPKKLSI